MSTQSFNLHDKDACYTAIKDAFLAGFLSAKDHSVMDAHVLADIYITTILRIIGPALKEDLHTFSLADHAAALSPRPPVTGQVTAAPKIVFGQPHGGHYE